MAHRTYQGDTGLEFLNLDVLQSPEIVFILANIVDSDELSHSEEFYLGLHCLLNYLLRVSRLDRVKYEIVHYNGNIMTWGSK